MTLRRTLAWAVLAALLVAATALGGEPQKPPPNPPKEPDDLEKLLRRLEASQKTPVELPKDYRWEDEAKKRKLSTKEVEFLAKNKVLMGDESFKQIFRAYTASDIPFFITSDSLLNAYHVLFETSLLRMEKANARKMPVVLRFLWATLQTADRGVKGNPELTAAAKMRAQIVIGTALRLLDDDEIKPDAKLAALIKEEAERVTAATGQHKPKWLGPPDDGFLAIDYTRYKPRGFYDRSEDLQRYFRAVSWLQSIPFRAEEDEELLAILLLGHCVTGDWFDDGWAKKNDYSKFLRCYEEFLPARDNWDVSTATQWVHRGGLKLDLKDAGLLNIRKEMLDVAGRDKARSEVNDRVRKPPKGAEVEFRIVSASRMPEAVLFQRTTDLQNFDRAFPSGLELCAALGSSYARSQLTGKDRDKLLAEIDAHKKDSGGYSLYHDHQKCLAALVGKPEPDAPAFLSNDAWRAKSCQTALGGWAQMRHALVLHSKESVHYLGASSLPSGFVEPVPEFYARMEELVEKTERLLRGSGAFDESGAKQMAKELKALADLLERKKLDTVNADALKTMTPDEQRLARRMADVLDWGRGKDPEGREAHARPLSGSRLRMIAEELENGQLISAEFDALPSAILDANLTLKGYWIEQRHACRTLERIAHKQLRRVPITGDEERFIIGYGKHLASLMLYEGHAYQHPKDDAVRIVDVFSNPKEGKYLEVGIGRPRVLYVLYPVKGGEILCRGAVMPYYEFPHAERLTDDGWKQLLDSPKRPAAPSWIGPLVVPSKEK